MSGTSSTQPAPTEAAPLAPEQRKAYAEIGAALEAGNGVRVTGKEHATFTNCTVHISDTQMLDWLIEHDAIKVQGSAERGWMVLDMNDGLTMVTRGHATYRDAIEAAMKKEQPK